MNKKRRLLIFLLVFAMAVLPLFVTGCRNNDDDDNVNVNAEDDLPPSFDGKQNIYGGKKFNVLTREDRQANQAWNIVDLVPNEELGDEAITKSVEERNNKIKRYFGVSIARDKVASGELAKRATTLCQQMNDDYSVFRLDLKNALTLALTGYLLDLNEERYIDLSQPWWDDGITESLLLYDGAYFGLGDVCTVDDDATWVVLFNKKIFEEQYDSQVIYNLVKDGNGKSGGWTIDRMKSYAQEFSREEQTEGIHIYDKNYTGGGRYGLTVQWEVAEALMVANNYTITKLDENDPMKVREVGADALYAAVDTVFNFMGGENPNQSWLLVAEHIDSGGQDMYAEFIRPMFMADRSLFFICHVGTIGLIREMESEFGILPMPKLNNNITDYGNTIQYGYADCYVIPNVGNASQAEFSSYILEALAYYSSSEYDDNSGEKASLTYAYYETVLKRKAVRDDESVEMLDLIFENRIFDISLALDLKSIKSVISETMQGDNNSFMSKYESVSPNGNGIYNALTEELKTIIELA